MSFGGIDDLIGAAAQWTRQLRPGGGLHDGSALRSSDSGCVDELGQVWMAASREGQSEHSAARLTRTRRGWRMDGVVTGPGALHRDGAFASPEGLSLVVGEGDRARILGYSSRDLRSVRGDDRWF